ncbi:MULTISPECIES: tyrosine-type recombinase/integrase [unclassified Hwanghaeella]|mgnify:CR=1 FL=1|jgi:integrase|uniref:tyrosine-type recombinase/integrase n=1 Tax=unclassified Hwanghaeella TaxID=2605944 RepID=UPI000C0A0BF8|nr:integrase [Gimesia sp.]MAO92721.1 integrase [Rhodospirillales bacterium]MAY54912.1 integrase [Gammaproteobacteria bacterium]|tara:strand:+ start:215 stop:1378 length:1164 start_codon:yes stop_codon:yes gene_type:complete
MTRLSKRTVDTLSPGEKEYFVWDEDMPGFGLRVWPTGRKVYLIQYRDSGGRTRRKGLGKHGVVTAEDARKEARELLASVARGANPSGDAKRKRVAPTVEELCERFMDEYVPSHCKASTAKEYRRNIDLFIKPRLGKMKVAEIERSDIADLHHAHREISYQANRTLGVLSVMFNQAEVWGLRPDGSNPCRHVKKYEEKKRERYLSTEELIRLGQTLNELEASGEEPLPPIHCIRLLILTGCRLSEIQTLQWSYVQGNRLRLPDSKTGAKSVYLGPAALEALGKIERFDDNPYVVTGKLPGTHLTDMQRPWRRIRRRAGLDDLRIHDLRHSFASSAVGMGESLPMIGKLLGHSQVQTTARYAHLADDPVQVSADRISGELARLMGGGNS